jgi:PAS domain S-box-containing protein
MPLTGRKNKELTASDNVLDSIADGVFAVDAEMRITSFNQAAELLTGFSREEAMGRPCHEIFRSDACQTACPLQEARETGHPVINRIVAIHRKDGTRMPITISASLLIDKDGNFVGGVETIRNRRHINTILDSVADGIFTVDDQMNIWTYNKAAEELTGIPYSEAVGRPCYEVFRSSVCESGCPVREVMETRQSVINREVEITDSKNHRKPVSISASILEDESGNITGAVETMRDLSLVQTLKQEIQQKFSFKNLVSRNPVMRRLFDVMADIAASEATVFLHGESGTGKELFARAIHELSPRRDGPLVIVNCGALPENLLEAEIFGVRKGAYTGAHENRPGRLELCEGGTFFLDEVGDLPLSLQVKLLRVLENREFQPVGGRTPLKADVRFIAATHRNLEEMVAQGTFRQDLYFRINIVTLHIPPLRERREDIPLLLDLALQRFNTLYGKRIKSVSADLLRLVLNYDFPGNVRELLNLMEQAVILCKGEQIALEHVPESFMRRAGTEPASVSRTSRVPSAALLAEVLTRHRGDRIGAAEELGVSRTTLWRWVRQAGLENVR